MIKNLIRDAKLATMEVVGEVKDMIHQTTTKLPEEVQKDYTELDSQSIPISENQSLEYLDNNWNNFRSSMTATQIDYIADKQNFIANVIQNSLLSFDAIEEDLRNMSMQQSPPHPSQLISLANRIDSIQRQIFNNLQELRNLSTSIDKATDKLQNVNNGWNVQNNNGWK